MLNRQRGVQRRIIGDVGHLHIERQVDQHRPRPPSRAVQKAWRMIAGHLVGLSDAPCCLADRPADGGDVDALKGLFAELGAHVLAGDGDQRHGVDLRRVQAGDEVGGRRAGGADGQRHLARGAEVAVGGMNGALFVAGNVVLDLLDVPKNS